MISIRKLTSLPRGTALRKISVLLQGFEVELKAGAQVDTSYIRNLFLLLLSGDDLKPTPRRLVSDYLDEFDTTIENQRLLRICNGVRHQLLKTLGGEPADWDLPETFSILSEAPDQNEKKIMPISVYLEDIRSPYNVGAIFRTAESFNVAEILLSEACPSPDHPRAKRSSMGCTDLVHWRTGPLEILDEFSHVFVLELGGEPVESFPFPADGVVIIGSEELGASPEARTRAAASGGRVTIPTFGRKGSLNVSAAFAIMLYAWHSRIHS
ncbi:MAG: TrmH family RNA methyltransferase [Spirochaetales bacterium]|nr:TrmH family RNA methyltransferase [Spirochaetales bacterium]